MRLSAVGLIVTFGIGLLLPPLGVAAPQPVKVHRIGVLTFSSQAVAIEELRQGLHELGYVEGRNLTLEVRSAEGKEERLADLAAERFCRKFSFEVICGMISPYDQR
jgi:putative tryptophan/tyrosine transport system substrate-binding protein